MIILLEAIQLFPFYVQITPTLPHHKTSHVLYPALTTHNRRPHLPKVAQIRQSSPGNQIIHINQRNTRIPQGSPDSVPSANRELFTISPTSSPKDLARNSLQAYPNT